ncbi:P22 coat - protein 5 family protein [Pseudomonas sp. KU26590]|uniref:P22 phage major capsid protein family protein n=1 Tax=Pseudomonas sp. KU26590 TaxID=2991051 RepID=UPI00223D87BF|nr:P22 phage major capsid protein family protein [Pseudomonas sp. KU26590]UZJ58564.1 P22 coat - protein 5 family protein [Pseudomonas sp. KU26590]
MSNTLTGLIGPLYEALDVVSRELVGFTKVVTLDASAEAAAVGQEVRSPVVQPVGLQDITPGLTAPNAGDHIIGNVPVIITTSKSYPIRWNGEEQKGLNGPAGAGTSVIMKNQFINAFRALGNAVDLSLASAAIAAASRATGTPGTTPFGVAGDLSDFALARKILEDNGAPTTALNMVINSSSAANLRGKQSVLFKVNEAGTDEMLRQGVIGRVEGFDVAQSAQLKTVVKGTGTGYLVNSTGLVIGSVSIPVDTGTGTILPGDAITFAGDPNVYMVNAYSAGVITIGGPGLQTAIADNTAITIGNSYAPNVAFAKSALVLAARAPAMPVGLNGKPIDAADDMMMITDPVSGLSFQLTQYRQYRQIYWEIGLAWGVKAVKPDHIAILRG